jgi:hypothetical protein
VKAIDVNRRQEPSSMGETADPTSPGVGGTVDKADPTADLRRVALAAYAAHLDKHARLPVAGASTPWGRAARIANLRRFNVR